MFQSNICFIIGEKTLHLFDQLLANSPNLAEISFKFISDEMFKLIASHCGSALRIIEAMNINLSSSEALIAVFKACPNIIAFRVHDEIQASLPGDDIIFAAVQYCPGIEVLPTHLFKLSNLAMDALAGIHTLKEITLTRAFDYSLPTFECVLQSNPSLEAIDLQYKVTDEILTGIGRHCHNLRCLEITDLYLYGMSIYGFEALFTGCPLMQELTFDRPGRMSNASLRVLFQSCPNLSTLDLRSPHYDLEDDTVPVLQTPYLSLTELDITREAASASALRDIFTYCTNLREVELYRCRDVSDELLQALTHNCRSLEMLTIKRCKKLTLAGLLKAVTHCTSLTSFELDRMPINDELLVQLSTYCLNLDELWIERCHGPPAVTDAGILSVADKCKQLTCMFVMGCGLEVTPVIESLNRGGIYQHIHFDIRD